jgi:hypothetical protein
MVFRIGDRDPATGLYYVIWPDDSSTLNGVKIFNAAHQAGDVVRMTRRSDGMMMLDGAKAVEVPSADRSISVKELGKPPEGYLNGQIWNTESPIDGKILTINRLTSANQPISTSLFGFRGIRIYASDLLIEEAEFDTGTGLDAVFGSAPVNLDYGGSFFDSGSQEPTYDTQILQIDVSQPSVKRYRYIVWQHRDRAKYVGSDGVINYIFFNDFPQVQRSIATNTLFLGKQIYPDSYWQSLSLAQLRQHYVGRILASRLDHYNNAYHTKSTLTNSLVGTLLQNETMMEGMTICRIDYLDPARSGYVLVLPSLTPLPYPQTTGLSVIGRSYVA